MFLRTIIIFFFILHLTNSNSENDALSNHMRKCCLQGVKHARKNDHCENYEYEVKTIPPLWIGLCHSTYGVCCSREAEKQHCIAGRTAAMRGLECNKKQQMNATAAYADCCRWCHLGLAVRASDSNCDDAHFQYFNEIESYRICCGSINKTSNERDIDNHNNKEKNDSNNNQVELNLYGLANKNDKHIEEPTDNETDSDINNADGTIILPDNDDDICGKGLKLCQHICENTLEAYRCKCHTGYKLNDDNVTCSLIVAKDEEDETVEDEELEASREALEIANVCVLGHVYDKIARKCVDVDECAIKGATERCKDDQYCYNTIGSYQCLNKEEANNSEDDCADCEEGYSCVEHGGSFKCVQKCPEGFHLSQGTCDDIDECALDDMVCPGPNQICKNVKGGYNCECQIGFRFDVGENECVDINECSINNHDCLSTQRCDNTLGSYVCTRIQSCGTGYTWDTNRGVCIDNDECKTNTHNCPANYECRNTQGSFRCYRPVTTTTTTTTTTPKTTTSTTTTTRIPYYGYYNHDRLYPSYKRDNVPQFSDIRVPCDIGFQRNQLGACVDVNECLVYQPCSSHQRCLNSNGSYRCQNLLDCGSGFKATPDGSSCNDIDECETGDHNCAQGQTCQNRHGGFICSCPPGYHLQNSGPGRADTCVDINECEQERPSICPLNADCSNSIGSYYCDCKTGFKKSGDNERLCIDVNECQEIPGLCQHKCNNFWGGYRCSCNVGYELSTDNRTCVDIDECEVHKNYKLCMGFCNNMPGSYDCSCPRGYTLEADKVRCRDIDECATGNFCTGRFDICTNTHGSYRCTTIRCPYGYQNDAYQKNRCTLMNNVCEGESCYTKPSAYSHNFITLTSNLTIPPEGRMIFLLSGSKFYDNIDFNLKLVKVQAAINIEKASDNHFDMLKEEKHQVALRLRKPLEGPQDIELELSMTVFSHGLPRGKSIAKIQIFVSQYEF